MTDVMMRSKHTIVLAARSCFLCREMRGHKKEEEPNEE